MAKLDQRGSKEQHRFYNLLQEVYPNFEIIYEQPIGELGQRIDLFIPSLGLAVEYDGIQHTKYSSFFYKDELAWQNAVLLDKKKNEFLEEHGVKLVRIPHNTKIKTAKELEEFINSVPTPTLEYIPFNSLSQSQLLFKEKRDKIYKQKKEELKNSDFHQKQKEALKLKRKEAYQKAKAYANKVKKK